MMIKQKIILKILSIFILSSLSFSSIAKELITTITVKGRVYLPTCTINHGRGLSQTIPMGSYSPSKIKKGETMPVDVPILIDCQASTAFGGVSIGLSSNQEVNGKPSILKTNLSGVFLNLKWKDDTFVNLSNRRKFAYDGTNIYDASMKVRVVGDGKTYIEKGTFRSNLNIDLMYY